MSNLANLLTSLTVIFGAFLSFMRIIKNLEELRNDFKENTLLTYKLAIMDDKMPLDERIRCGHKYIEMGGNGSVKRKVQDLEEQEYSEIYKTMEGNKHD